MGHCCCDTIVFRVCPFKLKRNHGTVIQGILMNPCYKLKTIILGFSCYDEEKEIA